MNNFLIYIFSFSAFFSCEKSKIDPIPTDKVPTVESFRKTDSQNQEIILQKDGQTTFIVKNKDSKFYEKRRNFSFDEYDWSSFQRTYGNLKNLKDFDLKDLPRRWVVLKQYKGQFYTYLPCDFCSDYTIQFSDQLVLENTCEGIIASKIENFKQMNIKDYDIQFDGRNITIHLINKMPGVAIFEEKRNYDLMIDVNFIEKYNLIKNECLVNKVNEMEFETPNYEKLLKN